MASASLGEALKVSRTNVPERTVDSSRVSSGNGGAIQSIDNLSIQGSACVSQTSEEVICSNNIDNGALSNSCEKAGQFQGKPLEKILVLEIFAGAGRLAVALSDKGFTSMAIDKDPSRCKQVHIVQYDLVDEAQRNSLLQLIDKEGLSILWAHFAPSCGTASRSRERPSRKFEEMGFSIPKPLRSDAFPLGLPNLQGLDREKVITTNDTYKAMIEVAERCLQWGIAISIENPGNSLFWKIPFVLAFINRVKGFDAVFHHCAHGGLRDKLTRWWANVDWFLVLAILWGKVGHEEAAYPVLLCTRLADIALQKALQMGAVQLVDLRQLATTGTTSQRFLLDMLPKGKKFRPLVSEYGRYVLVATAAVKNQP